MTAYDIFNGDADGICALVQMRRAEPRESVLVTGVKRDINLVDKVKAVAGDELLVLDVSHDVNRDAVEAALAAGASIRYFDHHFAGELPSAPTFEAHIDTSAETCTALLVDKHLGGRYPGWAIAAAFGDNLPQSARRRAIDSAYSDADLARLETLGICINYNGYGASEDDLHFRPAELYTALVRHDDPLDFLDADPATFERLHQGYRDDLVRAAAAEELMASDTSAALLLPAAAWSRRVSGVYANQLANAHPRRAHAILTDLDNGHYLVSVRAPLSNRQGADTLCRQFPTGGGRAAAGGINLLPAAELDAFLHALQANWA